MKRYLFANPKRIETIKPSHRDVTRCAVNAIIFTEKMARKIGSNLPSGSDNQCDSPGLSFSIQRVLYRSSLPCLNIRPRIYRIAPNTSKVSA